MVEAQKKDNFENKKYTYADLQKIDDDKRYELYDGELVMLASPTEKHQDVVGTFYVKLREFLNGKKCKPHFSRDVDLFTNKSTIVIPDVLVLCDSTKDDGKKINGAPDLVIEVLSSSTAKRDTDEKLSLYQKAGVKEYLIVNPEEQRIRQFLFKRGTNLAEIKFYDISDKKHNRLTCGIFPDFSLDLKEIFASK